MLIRSVLNLSLKVGGMKVKVSSSTAQVSIDAVNEILADAKDENPSLVILYGTANHEYGQVVAKILERYPETKISGSTSCMGIMTSEGFLSENATAMGAMLFSFESDDAFGVGISHKDNPAECAFDACSKSLAAAKREGELPSLIWIMCSPGNEEEYIVGIEKLVGKSVPIYGGSCADNDISGKWKIFNEQEETSSGVLIISFFDTESPGPVSSFHCGYEATSKTGTVTKAMGRTILEIDEMPALDVYNKWSDGALAARKEGDSILAESTLFPLGRNRGEISGIPFYLLSHPATVMGKGSFNLFTEIKENEIVCMMEGSINSLVNRASEVVKSILKREQLQLEDVSGALIVYCAGCMFAVNGEGKMNEVASDLKATLGDVPFMGVFTFGEQGSMLGKTNLHGNLMISVTLFRK